MVEHHRCIVNEGDKDERRFAAYSREEVERLASSDKRGARTRRFYRDKSEIKSGPTPDGSTGLVPNG